MTRISSAILAVGLLATPMSARPGVAAEPDYRPYLAFSGFAVQVLDSEFTDPAFPGVTFRFEPDTGLGLRGAIGRPFTPEFRAEAELAYRVNDLGDLCAVSCVSINGDVASLAIMGNVYYDLQTGGNVRPYLGLGLGFATVEVVSSDLDTDDSDTGLAYQLMLGLGFDVGNDVTLVGGYRYFATDDPTIEATKVEYETHNIEVGVRVAF